jgi:hypothetical protein
MADDCARRERARHGAAMTAGGGPAYVPRVDAVFRVAPEAQEIVDLLRDLLRGAVALRDSERKSFHLALTGWWFSHPFDPGSVPGERYRVEVSINNRWILQIGGTGALQPGTREMAVWAAEKLKPYMDGATGAAVPAHTDDDDGSGGDAELDITVSLAGKILN